MYILNYVVSLGASVMMPIIFTVIGLCIGLGFGKSVKSGLSVGVGFVGLSMMTTLLTDNLGPVINSMVSIYDLNTTILDVGWPTSSQIAYSSQIGALMIPICIGVNILMLVLKTTKTMNMDIWNYWHYAFVGSIIYVATDNFFWGIFGAIVNLVITMCIADFFMPRLQDFYGTLDGVSLAFPIAAIYAPLAVALNKMIDRIPLINKIDFDAEDIQKKFGVLGEPIFLGTIIGAMLAILARYNLEEILKLAVNTGAVLVLIPRITSLLIEGLKPISEATQTLIQKKFKGKEFWIGMSPSLVVGHPTNLVCSLLVVPFILFVSVFLPGNAFLPIASLAGAMYIFPFVIPIMSGNVFRTFIFGMLALIAGNYISTSLAPIFTESALLAGTVLPEGIELISSFDYGGHPAAWIIYQFTVHFSVIGPIILTTLCLGLLLFNRKRIITNEKRVHQLLKNSPKSN